MNEFDYIYMWLCESGLTTKQIIELEKYLKDIRELLDIKQEILEKTTPLDKKVITKIFESKNYSATEEKYFKNYDKGIRFCHVKSAGYPKKLLSIYDYPRFLFVKGELPENEVPSVAIVGARECSEYGREMAYYFAKELGNAGVDIISGMARGIDTFAHKGCLAGIGKTYAVLGCGVDNCYPRENIEMYGHIIDRGGIISEYPVGTKPLPHQFPIRNRIISGLADAVIVVEAQKKSGSLITAEQALEQNREIFAIPGRITDRLSGGCNNLIKIGANALESVDDVLEYLGNIYHINVKKNQNINISLARNEKMVYSCLDLFPKSLTDIMNETNLELQEVMNILMKLQLLGIIRETSKNYYVIVWSE